MDQIGTRWCLSERRLLRKTLRDLTHPLMRSNRTLCSLDARSKGQPWLSPKERYGKSARDLKGLLIDRLFTRPVDCFLCHHD